MLTGVKSTIEVRPLTIEKVLQITGPSDYEKLGRKYDIRCANASGGAVGILEHQVNLIKVIGGYALQGEPLNLDKIFVQLTQGKTELLLWQVEQRKAQRSRNLRAASERLQQRRPTPMW